MDIERTKQQKENAQKRIDIFEQRYGDSALKLARYAAFPLTLTTDLSYCLREKFTPEAPWYVAADLLISGLCDSVGYDLYEMTTATRYLLLDQLLQEEKGEDKFNQVANFMAAYINHRLKLEGEQSRRTKGLGYPPEWISLAYLKKDVDEIAEEIRKQIQKLLQGNDPKESLRLATFVESQADMLALRGLEPLTLQTLVQQLDAGTAPEDLDEWAKLSQILRDAGFPALETREIEVATVSFEKTEELQPFRFTTVKLDPQGQIIEPQQTATAFQFWEPLEGQKLGLEMVAIPRGKFIMGSLGGEPERDEDEGPQHEVTVQPFFISRYPVTQAQWRFVAGLPQVKQDLDPDPSEFEGDKRPVEQVSWYEAVEFCDRLSVYTGRRYRLPTEAEWEYACRAGTTTPFHFGETITPEVANYDGNYTYNDGTEGEYREETTPVDHFNIANGFGLCDMHGNVFEWCLDHWHDSYEGAPNDGSAWLSDNEDASRVLRGGSWYYGPWYCRSACRDSYSPGTQGYNIGFRVVCVAPRTL